MTVFLDFIFFKNDSQDLKYGKNQKRKSFPKHNDGKTIYYLSYDFAHGWEGYVRIIKTFEL